MIDSYEKEMLTRLRSIAAAAALHQQVLVDEVDLRHLLALAEDAACEQPEDAEFEILKDRIVQRGDAIIRWIISITGILILAMLGAALAVQIAAI